MRRGLALLLLLIALGLGGLAAGGMALWQAGLERYAGAWRFAPEDAEWVLPQAARDLIAAAFADIERPVADARIMTLSTGRLAATLGEGPTLASRAEPDGMGEWLGQRLRRHAAGMHDPDLADAQYAARLLRQMQAMPGGYRARLFARDATYSEDGAIDLAASREPVANAYVVWLAGQAPARLVPVVSVHPYRRDLRAALARWAAAGVSEVSWEPAIQQIDLSSAAAIDAYAVMAANGMRLALRLDDAAQVAGLREALAAGVEVSVALGDVDAEAGRALLDALFATLREPALRSRLTLELGGLLASDQIDGVLAPLLQHPQFFDRMRFASGYPESAVAMATDPGRLAARGFIDPDLVEPLRAIYAANPLLYVYVAMRQVRLPTTGLAFPTSVFIGGAS